jgi:hypothetical protein
MLFALLYLFSLLGNKRLLTDLKGLQEEYKPGRSHDPQYSTIALLGQFKGEKDRLRHHLMYSVDKTGSGIEVRKYISDLIVLCHSEGHMDGPAICDLEGHQWTTTQANKILHELTCSLFDQEPIIFPLYVSFCADIWQSIISSVCLGKHQTLKPLPRASICQISWWSITGTK